MQVQVERMGAFKIAGAAGPQRLDVPEGTTVDEVLTQLGIAATEVHVVLINGRPQPDHRTPLAPGDLLTVLPLVSGG